MVYVIERDLEKFKQETIPPLIEIADSDGWSHIKTVEEVECSYKKMEGSPLVLVRGQGIIDSPMDEFLTWLGDPHCFSVTDPMVLEWKIVETLAPAHTILHTTAKMPPMITNRDFVWQGFDGLFSESPRIGVSAVRSIEYEPIPPIPGFVRAELAMSGYIVREVEGDPKKCNLTYLIQADPKGWLPVWVVNLVAGDQAMNVVRIKRHFAEKAEEDKVLSVSVGEDETTNTTTTTDTEKQSKKSKKKNKKKKHNKKGGK